MPPPTPVSISEQAPFLEMNWEVTPTSNVPNTGEWSLVTISSVQPVQGDRNGGSRELSLLSAPLPKGELRQSNDHPVSPINLSQGSDHRNCR